VLKLFAVLTSGLFKSSRGPHCQHGMPLKETTRFFLPSCHGESSLNNLLHQWRLSSEDTDTGLFLNSCCQQGRQPVIFNPDVRYADCAFGCAFLPRFLETTFQDTYRLIPHPPSSSKMTCPRQDSLQQLLLLLIVGTLKLKQSTVRAVDLSRDCQRIIHIDQDLPHDRVCGNVVQIASKAIRHKPCSEPSYL
jgi:hypothetical protein